MNSHLSTDSLELNRLVYKMSDESDRHTFTGTNVFEYLVLFDKQVQVVSFLS